MEFVLAGIGVVLLIFGIISSVGLSFIFILRMGKYFKVL